MAVRVGAQIQPQQASCRQMRDEWLRVKEMERSIHLKPNLARRADCYVENGITHLTVGIGGLRAELVTGANRLARRVPEVLRGDRRELGEYFRMIDRRHLSPNYSRPAMETELLDLYLRG